MDDSGAFFVDRDGDLFGIILQWLRTYDRPSQRNLSKYGDTLLEECNFYGETTLPQIIRGELAPSFYLKSADRAILNKEEEAKLPPMVHIDAVAVGPLAGSGAPGTTSTSAV